MKYIREATERQDIPIGIHVVSAYDGGNRVELTDGANRYVVKNLRRPECDLSVGATVMFDGTSLAQVSPN